MCVVPVYPFKSNLDKHPILWVTSNILTSLLFLMSAKMIANSCFYFCYCHPQVFTWLGSSQEELECHHLQDAFSNTLIKVSSIIHPPSPYLALFSSWHILLLRSMPCINLFTCLLHIFPTRIYNLWWLDLFLLLSLESVYHQMNVSKNLLKE